MASFPAAILNGENDRCSEQYPYQVNREETHGEVLTMH